MVRRHTNETSSKGLPTVDDGDADRGNGSQKGSKDPVTGRRTFIKGAAVGASLAVAPFTGTAGAATERHGITFQRVVNMVDDMGADDTGSQPVQSKIRSAAANDTLLVFPSGTYRINGQVSLSNMRNFGIYGDGDVTFKLDGGFQGWIPNVDQSTGVLFENITIDQTARNAIGWTRFGSTGYAHVQDITVNGVVEPVSRDAVKWRCLPFCHNSSANVYVENFVARDGGMPGTYRKGGGGIFVGPSNKGTVKLVDCEMWGYPNNGVYAGRSEGPVQIEGGVYKNNEVSQIRLSGKGSYADGCTLIIDIDDWEPHMLGNKRDALNMRAVWFEAGRSNDEKPSGGELRNLDIYMKSVTQSQGGIQVDSDAGRCTVKNCHIETDLDNVAAIQAYVPDGGYYKVPPKPWNIRVENTHITGSASGGSAVRIYDRDNSYVRNSCIHQTGSDRDGVTFIRSNDGDITDTNINVTGTAIDLRRCSASTGGITHNDTCTRPGSGSGDGGSNGDGSSGDGSSGDGSNGDGSNGGSDPAPGDGDTPSNELVIRGNGNYAFDVSETVEPHPSVGTFDSQDTIEGTHAEGLVEGGTDGYVFDTEVTDFSYDGDVTVTLNGSSVDPNQLGSTEPEHVLTLNGGSSDQAVTYDLSVTDNLKQTDHNGSSINPDDEVTGNTVTGKLWGFSDSYTFTGEITEFAADGEVTATLDGESHDLSQYGSGSGDGSEPEQLPNTITFNAEETGNRSEYWFEVTGEVQKASSAEADDTVDGTYVEGVVEGDVDEYRFSGNLTDGGINGDAAVRFQDNDG